MSRVPTFVQVQQSRPMPEKAIFWPGAAGYGKGTDRTQFPEREEIRARASAMRAEPLEVFILEVRRAQDRVFVVDEYLFKNEKESSDPHDRLDAILSWFPDDFAAKEVCLLGKTPGPGLKTLFRERLGARAEEIRNGRGNPSLTILANFNLRRNFPYIHDRFAIIDDELWHFGATVGGLHEHLNAASRGWRANEHRAEGFFRTLWGDCQDTSPAAGKRSRTRSS